MGSSEPITLYDEAYPYRFDPGERDKPDSKLFRDHDKHAKRRKLSFRHDSMIESAILAHINLRTRQLTGLVLGSAAGDLIEQPESVNRIESYGTHRDLDVLILNPFSSNMPAPSEWGIDWWVRPPSPDTTIPTNGRTTLWYDAKLKPEAKTIKERVSKKGCPLSYDFAKRAIRLDHRRLRDVRRSIQQRTNKLILAPGLYLPHPKTMEQIVGICNAKVRCGTLREKMIDLAKRIEAGYGDGDITAFRLLKKHRDDENFDYEKTLVKETLKIAKQLEAEVLEIEEYLSLKTQYFVSIDKFFETLQGLNPGEHADCYLHKLFEHLRNRLQQIERRLSDMRYYYLLVSNENPGMQMFPVLPPNAVTITPSLKS